MVISERLGERKIINLLQNSLDVMPGIPVPFGEDVSAVCINGDQLLVLKTDMLVGKTDVPPNMSLWQASRKAVVMNISDFAAKGVKPMAMVVSLGLPEELITEENIKQIGEGLNAGATEYNAYIIGGDTNEASDLVISISLIGTAKKDMLILRSGAEPGDIVAVTGFFGKTSAGLKILCKQLDASQGIRKTLVDSILMPHARLKEGLELIRANAVTACIDSSDGLAWSLHEIAKASNVGFLIKDLPIARETKEFAKMHRLDPAEMTLYGGEEYELVLTVKPKLWKRTQRFAEIAGGRLMPIGTVTAKKHVSLDRDGEKSMIEPRGWEHFKTIKP